MNLVPRIENADDIRHYRFARRWVDGFALLERAARDRRHVRFLSLAARLRDELEKVPEVFALNRDLFVARVTELQESCAAEAA